MKTNLFAAAAMFAVIGGASATENIITERERSFPLHQLSSSVTTGGIETGRESSSTAQSGKSREQVRQELRDHQQRMKTDRAYRERWNSMFESS
jgi:hypothetical protein